MAAKDLTISSAEIAAFPLAQIAGGKPLSLSNGLNPAWMDGMAKIKNEVAVPLLNNGDRISEADWAPVSAPFRPYEAWQATKVGATVEKLGLPRVREILGGKSRESITALIAKDKALEPEANAITAVERLIRYHRDLFRLLNNFVSFWDFYSRKEK